MCVCVNLFIQQTAQFPLALCWALEMNRDDSNTVSISLGEIREFHTKNLGFGVSRLECEPQLYP